MNNSQSGNVLFYILIAVALLAGLMFAVSQSGRGSTKQLSEDRAGLMASEIIEYSDTIANAVAQLKLRGCKDNEISFETPSTPDYANTNAPTDGFCNVFSINGGAISPLKIQEDWLDNTIANTEQAYGDTIYTGTSCVPGVGKVVNSCFLNSGEANAELLFLAPYLKLEICNAINDKLNNGFSTPPADISNAWMNTGKFIGNYAGPLIIYNGTEDFDNQHSICMRAKGAGTVSNYVFYKVLIAR